jgi:dipeptidyl aminopeptidase/acylaminoacyl peptidase
MDADGGSAAQASHDIASVMSPAWSPDGRWIAFAGGREEGGAQTRLFLLEVATGRVEQLGHDDLEVALAGKLSWTEDSRSLVLVIAHHACQHVVEVSVPGGEITTRVDGERHIAEVAITRGRLVYFSESAAAPRELFATDRQGAGERQLSFVNAWWDERTPLHAEIRRFTVPDGEGGTETIEGWVVRVKGATGPQKVLLEAHGGPNAFALLGYPWNTYWNVLCSQGWTICVPHAVGSTSFGRRFAERLNGHWGELDFPQFLAVLDALQADGTANDKAVIAGKSYGGYMSAWAIGHTDRFKAAIVAAPVANLDSHLGTSDGGYYSQPYTLSGERHVNADRYRALSPVNYIHRCTTPTLFLQGEDDQRCPRGQSEELFTAVMRHGKVPAEMVIYPGGDHHLY